MTAGLIRHTSYHEAHFFGDCIVKACLLVQNDNHDAAAGQGSHSEGPDPPLHRIITLQHL